MSDLSTLEHVDTSTTPKVQDPGDGNHDLFSHYVSKAALGVYYLDGTLPTALCGKKWAPGYDVVGLTVCPACKEVYAQMQPGDPENPDYGK